MNNIILLFFVLLSNFLIAQPLDQQGIPEAPSPPRLVNDFAGMISPENITSLEKKLVDFNDSTSTQITIVTVETIGDYEISDYTLRLGRKWGIGQKDKNNGILFLIAKNDRKIDIEIGYGLESFITDYDTKHIIEELITPAFKQSNYYEGIDDAVNRLIGLMQGSYTSEKSEEQGMPIWLILLIIVIFLIFIINLPKNKGNILIGGGGWRTSGGGWTGGGGWSGGGGSSSGGGFGGFGGGSFGGGGSSGSW